MLSIASRRMQYHYRLLNVFTLPGQALSGNPLCVFEDARGLSDQTMQALARQFNLSETTFILPDESADELASARVRIFTPEFELPFAGHPTLGTAQVVRELRSAGDALTLRMQAGVIPVTAHGDAFGNEWTLQANTPTSREVAATTAELAAMLGLSEGDIGSRPLWINTGSEQLMIPLTSVAAVQRATPDVTLLQRYAQQAGKRFLAYVFAPQDEQRIVARFFFAKGSAAVEDPATGSACANLGGWFIAHEYTLPLQREVRQGNEIQRPSRLGLRVDGEAHIFVTGQVVELGRGTITIEHQS